MLLISEKLINSLNSSSIAYLHWKGNNHYEDGFNGVGDIDLLVSKNQKNEVHKLLIHLKFAHFNTQAAKFDQDIEDWLGFDYNTGKLVHLHLHFKMILGQLFPNQYVFTIEPFLYAKQDVKSHCFLQNPIIEYLLLLSRKYKKCISNKKYAKNFDFLKSVLNNTEANHILRDIGLSQLDVELIISSIYNQNLVNEIFRKKILDRFIRTNCKWPLIEFLNRTGMSTLTNLGFLYKKKTLTNKGFTLVFLGQDGAGKSTIAKLVEEWLSWKVETHNIYLGNGDHYFSWRKKMRDLMPSTFITKPIRALLTISDLKHLAKNNLRKMKNAQSLVENGCIIIYDRYPQIKYEGINDGPKIRINYADRMSYPILKSYVNYCSNIEEKLLAKSVNIKPNVVFKLMLTPEESIKRKPHEDIRQVEKKHEIIKSLEFPESRVEIIDAMQNFDSEILQIKRIIWETIINLE